MKKLIYILIIPFFISCYQETNLDFLFNGLIEPSDSTLIDSITGVSDPDYKLTDVDFDITLGYLPGKTKAKLNGQPICTYFQNANFADTSFTQWLDQTLNANLTELLPKRIQRIAHYSTPTPDVNDYFQTPFTQTGTMLDVCATCTYTDILAANTAASSTDTIICFNGSYTTFDFTKSIYIKNVGNSTIDCSTNAIDYNGNGLDCILDGFEITGTTGTRLIEYQNSDGNGTMEVRNSSLYNNYIMLWGGASNPVVTVNNSLMSGLSNLAFKDFFINECYIYDNPSQTLAPIRITDGLLNLNYCNIEKNHATEYAIDIQADGNARAFDCDVENMFYRSISNLADSLVFIDHCNIYNTDASTLLSLNGTSANVEIRNTTFTDGAILLQDNTSVLIDSCVFNNPNTTITIGNTSTALTFTFSNDSLTDDANGKLSLINVYGSMNNSRFYSTADFNIVLAPTIDVSALDFDIHNNRFEMNTLNNVSYFQKTGNFSYNLMDFYGNYFKFPLAFGTAATDNHAALIFNTNAVFRHNLIEGAHNGWVSKKPNDATLINECYGNIFKETERPLWWRSSPNSLAYNNTFYNDTVTLVYAVYLDDDGTGLESDSCIFRNNIIESSTGDYMFFETSDDSTGFISSNNIVFGATDVIINSNTSTFATWQGLGYDLNSFNTDPNFKSSTQLWPIYPSDAIGNALNLGAPYNTALNISSVWPYSIVNKQQFARWSMGAYIPPFETIDNYVADTLMSIWADKMNQTIKIFLNSNDTIELETP